MENDGNIIKTAFGLDIAGYSTGNSVFARACRKNNNSIMVTVYHGNIFSNIYYRKDFLDNVAIKERELLQACCKNSTLIVDTPIDFQGLPHSNNALFVWQLTLRPVDYAFGGLPPLADKIGVIVARFQNMMSASTDLNGTVSLVGTHIFETYPARSLYLLNLPYKKYKKNPITFKDGHWTDGEAAKIAEGLGLIAENGVTLNDDELDAIICALTGIVDNYLILQDDELKHEISDSIKNKMTIGNIEYIDVYPPLGYVLLKERPNMEIVLEIKTFDDHESMMEEVFCNDNTIFSR